VQGYEISGSAAPDRIDSDQLPNLFVGVRRSVPAANMEETMTSRRFVKSFSVILAKLLLAVVIGNVTAGWAQAQGAADHSGNPAILTAVKTVQNGVNLLQSSVDKLSGLSFADTLFTPMLQVGDPEDFAACSVVNISAVQQIVRIELISDYPLVLGADTFSLLPGEGALRIADKTNRGGTRLVYCKFALLTGSKNDVRAALYMAPIGGTAKVAVPAE
jgi:hypothetical protein